MLRLSDPLNTKKLALKNRLVFPPMATEKSDEDGQVTKSLLEHYNKKTLGGYIGLVIVEHSYVNLSGRASSRQLSVCDDKNIDGLKELCSLIQKNGSKAILQISHAGSATHRDITGQSAVAPSKLPNPRKGHIPKALTEKEISIIVKDFQRAAFRAQAAGYDGVEIHSAHGYLLNQFFSPLTNKRSDGYGGNLEKRIRIHLEIINEIKNTVGEDFPLFLRLGTCDYADGGIDVKEVCQAVKHFENAGIDIIDVSGGFCGYGSFAQKEQGYFSPFSLAIKKSCTLPVILTGGITTKEGAEALLNEKKADLIGVGRPIYKDDTWTKRIFQRQ